MKFGVVVFPGSNCDRDMKHVLSKVLEAPTEMIWHKEQTLTGFSTSDCIIIPGGFSYGDYLRSGAIARFSPVMQAVIDFAHSGGKVFGICNGFQILCEAQLLPGVLLKNRDQKFICKNVLLRTENADTPLTNKLQDGEILNIPIAHADGRFHATPDTLKEMNDNNQILFRYCNSQGELKESANPNGSVENIAGICNVSRNVFGMMPHPERAAEPILGNTDGLKLFESLLKIAVTTR